MKCFIVLAMVASAYASDAYGYAAPSLCAGAYNGYTGTSDPSTFIQCSNGIPNVQKCAYGTVWNQYTLTCEHYGAPAKAISHGPAAAIVGHGLGLGKAGLGLGHGIGLGKGLGLGHGIGLGKGLGLGLGKGIGLGHAGLGLGKGLAGGYGGCGGAYDGLSGVDGAPYYIQCSNGIAYQQKCAYGTGWSNYSKRCE